MQQEEVVEEQEQVEHIEPTYVITLQVFMYSVCVESVRFVVTFAELALKRGALQFSPCNANILLAVLSFYTSKYSL